MTTMQRADLTGAETPNYNVSSSCLWTFATLIPLAILLVILAF
ncbi:hypothetical protein [Gordonia sp. X0973]|nr:hypothetical protein [Gordonia sp. X0973]